MFSRSDRMPPVNPWEPFLDTWHKYVTNGGEPPFSGRNNLKIFALLSAAIESTDRGESAAVADNPRYAVAFATE